MTTLDDSAAREAGARTAYLVLGMHRSGTSAVTQLLALAGAKLPANVMPGDEHNEKGYFEPWRIALFNDTRLRAAGSAWDDAFAFPFRPLPEGEEAIWLGHAYDLFRAEYRRAAVPLMKDPRMTVLLPFWRRVLERAGVGARCVVPVRHPLAVAGSLKRRDGFPEAKSVLVWTSYMLAAEAYTRDLPRAFVGYDALLADWRAEVARIEVAHGAPLPRITEAAARRIDAFLTPELRHNTALDGLAALGWAGEIAAPVLAWFEAAAAGETPDRAPLDAAAAELARRRDEMGALVSSAAHDLDVARGELRAVRDELAAERRLRAELAEELQRQRDTLEAGWRRDVKRLEKQVRAFEARLAAMQATQGRLEAALAGVAAELDAALEED
jgi:hypothetical protein